MGKVAHLQSSSACIAAAVAARRRLGARGAVQPRTVAAGAGWRILDVLCTCDAQDRAGEERHSHYSLALVLAGAFEYRGQRGCARLPPGSILLGQAGAAFKCWHAYGSGDRCLAIQFETDAFEEFLATRGVASDPQRWPVALPVDRRTVGLFAAAELIAGCEVSPDRGLDFTVTLADRIVRLADAARVPPARIAPRDAARLLELARWIESDPAAEHSLPLLAQRAGISKYHLVRQFRRVVGLPPHAFIRRARLRNAAVEIGATELPVLDVALRAGFSDVSTFNAAFRHHFAHSPRELRRRVQANGHYDELTSLETSVEAS